jgi:general secretion pathway protein A
MVLNYYKLAEQPFGVTPDIRFLFLSPTHREALASVLYGVSAGRGFTALIAKPGMGKTTILFDFLDVLKDSAKTAFLFQPQCTAQDLFRSLLSDLGVEEDGTDFVRMYQRLIGCLLNEARQGRQLVVVVDEAQNLDDSILELLRMLSNFETPQKKLMHLVLVGQPQLAKKLASPHLTQLRQRISIVARLEPFSAEETQMYIDHRLRVAGYDFAKPLFTKQAYQRIAQHSEGIPRNINNLCFNAMSLGCVGKKRTIDVDLINEVINDLDLRSIYMDVETAATKTETPKPIERVSHRSFLQRWSFRFALALALGVLIGWPLMRTNRSAADVPASESPIAVTHAEELPANSEIVPTEEQQTPVPAVEGAQEPSESTRTIRIALKETLYMIMIKNFGKYDKQMLAKLRQLNPEVSDPRRLKVGQEIRVPSGSNGSENNISATKRAPAGAVAGAQKP